MLKLVSAIILIICGLHTYAQPYGLQFSSHEVIPEKRTSLDITGNTPFRMAGETEISFDLMFQPHKSIYFGYIMRLITTSNQTVDIIYNQRSSSFNFVNGEQSSGTMHIDTALLQGGWNHFVLRINPGKKKLFFSINDSLKGSGPAIINPADNYRLYFGVNSYEGFQTIDIPPMCIKNVSILNNGKLHHFFPLSESEGTVVNDTKQNEHGVVKNPVWIKPRHQKWEPVYSVNTKATASVAFDKRREILYIAAADSLYSVNFTNMEMQEIPLSTRRDSLPAGNQSVYIPLTDSLYNFYIDSKGVSRYDPVARRWSSDFSFKDLTVYWQANKFFSAVDTSLYIIGGYGQLQYKNQVQQYHLNSRRWEPVNTSGDFYMPRYMASAGTNENGDTAYFIGGYGSTTGDQTINPRFIYDVTLFDVRSKSFRTLFHLKEPARQFCFANHMVIEAGTNNWYALTYPTDRFNAALRLIQGSLSTPSYTLPGDSIPFSYYDIASYADLYYCETSKKLVAVTIYTANSRSAIKVYTIDFPPGMVTTSYAHSSTGRMTFVLWAGILLLLSAGAYFLFRRYTRKVAPGNRSVPVPEEVPQPVPLIAASAIYLFGNFEVYNKERQDIATQLSPLLKELLLLILTHTIQRPRGTGKGISQEKLFDILWRDKSPKDAKNNYSVNIAKLKPVFESIGNCHIEKTGGKIHFVTPENAVHIDYGTFMSLLKNQHQTAAERQTLFSILERGSLLNEFSYSWLGDIQSEVSNMAIDWLLANITSRAFTDSNDIIRITNTVFLFDQLNEIALEYKCKALIAQGRHGLALETFQHFEKEYEHSYGEKPRKTFNEITM